SHQGAKPTVCSPPPKEWIAVVPLQPQYVPTARKSLLLPLACASSHHCLQQSQTPIDCWKATSCSARRLGADRRRWQSIRFPFPSTAPSPAPEQTRCAPHHGLHPPNTSPKSCNPSLPQIHEL